MAPFDEWTLGSTTGPKGPTFVMALEAGDEPLGHSTEAQIRLVADAIPVLAWYADPDGRVHWFNKRWLEYTGKTIEEQAGLGWQSILDADDLPRVLASWRAAVERGEPWEDMFRLRRRDGELRWFLSRAMPLRDAAGRFVRWFGMNIDVDDRKRERDRLEEHAQAELRASEEQFHRLVDAIADYAIFMIDATGHVATWNLGAERIKGYRRDEILGRHFSVFYLQEERDAGHPERNLETVRREGRFEEEGWRLRKDGSRFWANVVITALRDGAGAITGFAKVTRDLTARRAAEEREKELAREQLARAASEKAWMELERINRAKDEFLATMSHELRTPLNAIHGWASILRRKPREEEKLERGLEAIERNAKAQTKLISDLLDVSRIITGKLRLALLRTDVFHLMVAAADVVKAAAEAKGVRLVVDVDPAIGVAIVDPDRLQQIIWNLLTNAIRFTPRGGRVTLVGDRSSSGIVIGVQDTGAGIAAEHLPHLFERFMQVDSSTTRAHAGLGLGLSIVRHLVEAHGGSVMAASGGLGQGATFTVRIPVRAVDEARPTEEGATTASAEDEAPMGGERESGTQPAPMSASLVGVRVLVVEDDPDSAEVVCTVLQRAGARVTQATSARAAFEAFDASGPFDVIVSDIGMPEMDGYALMRRIRSREAGGDVPAIALTAYARSEDAEHALRAGFQEHLAKPIEEARLLAAVRTWSGKHPPSSDEVN